MFSVVAATVLRYLSKKIWLFETTRQAFQDHYTDLFMFFRLTHSYTFDEKTIFIHNYLQQHGMRISSLFFSELLQCDTIAEITEKLVNYKPVIYELIKYTPIGLYPKVVACISFYLDHRMVILATVAGTVLIASALLGVYFFSETNKFAYDEQVVNGTVIDQGQFVANVTEGIAQATSLKTISELITFSLGFFRRFCNSIIPYL
jgi:hypothetical protein